MKNEIILKAEGELNDKLAREQIDMLWTKIGTINDRTKQHTLDIQELKRKLKEKSK